LPGAHPQQPDDLLRLLPAIALGIVEDGNPTLRVLEAVSEGPLVPVIVTVGAMVVSCVIVIAVIVRTPVMRRVLRIRGIRCLGMCFLASAGRKTKRDKEGEEKSRGVHAVRWMQEVGQGLLLRWLEKERKQRV
jgi:hypothetical protein